MTRICSSAVSWIARNGFGAPSFGAQLVEGTKRNLSVDSRLPDSPEQRKEDHAYCVNLVQERDREGWLCGLLMPKDAQQPYFALRAFNTEIASVKDGHSLRRRNRDQPKETAVTLALQMRMAWWRDAVGQIYGDEPKGSKADPTLQNLSISCWHSPVVRQLNLAHQQCQFTRRFLERLIDSRETDLEVNQYTTMDDAALYAEESVSSLLYLSFECAGVRDEEADVVASHAGVGIGLTTALRATPFRLLHGEVPIPAELFPPTFAYDELLSWQNDSDEFTLTENDAKVLDDAIRSVAHVASTHLAQARALQSQVTKAGKPCLLPVIPSLIYLEKLEKSGYNLFHPNVTDAEKSRLRLLLLLARTWLTGVF